MKMFIFVPSQTPNLWENAAFLHLVILVGLGLPPHYQTS